MLAELFGKQLDGWETINQGDDITYHRPYPLHRYDQVFMRGAELYLQAMLVMEYTKGKRVAFLGDGDGVSSLLMIKADEMETPPTSVLLLDFDERIINAAHHTINGYQSCNQFEYMSRIYNILDPIPDDLKGNMIIFISIHHMVHTITE